MKFWSYEDWVNFSDSHFDTFLLTMFGISTLVVLGLGLLVGLLTK